jgi:hypothetical protein
MKSCASAAKETALDRPLLRLKIMRSLIRGRAALAALSLVMLSVFSSGCSTEDLSDAGAKVVASRNAPPQDCEPLGFVVGHGGGTFGGAFISNNDLIEYAMNDLRNQAAERGGNYVQYDTPTMGDGDGTTTTATVSGTAFRCP